MYIENFLILFNLIGKNMFFKSFRMRRRILKTLERFKFKVDHPESKVYGVFRKVRKYNSGEFICYELDKFKFNEYKHEYKVVFYYDSKPQIVIRGHRATLITEYNYLNDILDLTDSLTNNSTR